MNLPRQARYKHRETLKKRCVLRRSLPARTSGGNVGDGFAQYSDGAKRLRREVVRQNENAAFFIKPVLYIPEIVVILPRQARDKHRKTTQNEDGVSSWSAARDLFPDGEHGVPPPFRNTSQEDTVVEEAHVLPLGGEGDDDGNEKDSR
jgi:hypothetical protein